MAIKLFVGNISWNVTNDQLQDFFAQHGTVEDAFILKDRETGRSKGFGFVTFTNDEEGRAAIEALNGQELDGRELTVNEARPKQD